MIINHNLPAINAHRQMGINNSALSKSLEKLSSGLGINRASDNAAGLAISEKMRGQISGLNQASKNAQDGISLIQTAEGALNETHSILQRMRELSVQSANGTYQDEVDRENIQKEVDALKSEVDRIATSTHYNNIKLLDGSLGGASNGAVTSAGPKFGAVQASINGAFVTSDVAGVTVSVAADAATAVGTETAIWDDAGTTLTLNLAQNTTYTQAQIDDLIANAKQEDSSATGVPAKVTMSLNNGVLSVAAAAMAGTATVAGVKSTGVSAAMGAGEFVGANTIRLTSNRYGADNNMTIHFDFTAEAGKEEFETDAAMVISNVNAITTPGEYTLHLAAGKEYTEQDIQDILKENGIDVTVQFTSANPDAPDTLMATTAAAATLDVAMAGGAGLGDTDALRTQSKYDSTSSASAGLTFQIGANGSVDQRVSLKVGDMSARGLGVNNISVAQQDSANKAIATIDNAINSVSGTRADLGALQNRMEHTINSLGVASENLTAAESRIRDVDMAKEMMEFTKTQILSQASQAMLAQANTLPQGVLQLLQ